MGYRTETALNDLALLCDGIRRLFNAINEVVLLIKKALQPLMELLDFKYQKKRIPRKLKKEIKKNNKI